MKCVNKAIEVLAYFDCGKYPKPFRFRLGECEETERLSVNVDRIRHIDENKFCGNIMYTYFCESVIDERLVMYELSYEPKNCSWRLVKI